MSLISKSDVKLEIKRVSCIWNRTLQAIFAADHVLVRRCYYGVSTVNL